MPYDLVIKNGTVIDGSGLPRYRADVGVRNGKIATIGRIRESAQEVIDAEGHVVTPGFVDGHTHMDAQVFWDPLGTSSCYHGITTVVMGNCGFTLAPCAEKDKHLVVRNLQRAEDIPPAAMEAGIKWTWTTYPEFLDAVEALPKGINYAGYVGHSAIRTFVMGERAFDGPATEDDLQAMEHHVRESIRAGAMGFTTLALAEPTRRRTAARWRAATRRGSEVRRLVDAMGELNAGHLRNRRRRRRSQRRRPRRARVAHAAARSRGRVGTADHVRRLQPARRRTASGRSTSICSTRPPRMGGRMFAQAHSRSLSALLSFKTQMPFDRLPVWKDIRKLPIEEQKRKLARSRAASQADPGLRRARRPQGARHRGAARRLRLAATCSTPSKGRTARSREVARERNQHPAETMIELALEKDLDLFFLQPVANEDQDIALEIMRHPRTVTTFSDSGAHVSQLMDSSLQTHLLYHWVRTKQAFTLEQAVHMLTCVPATLWGFHDRGLIREGMAADIVVFDPDTIMAEMPEVVDDLPAGARRLVQRTRGIAATVVNGQILLRNGKHTGALPGKLLRGPLGRQ